MASERRNRKKELLLLCAQRLMLRQGYWATTIESICAATKLSKGVFFHYFDSKKDLGSQVLQMFFESMNERLRQSLSKPMDDPLERLEQMLDTMAEILASGKGPRGCLIAAFVVDTAESEPALRRRCLKYFRAWAEALQAPLDEAIHRYCPNAGLDGRQLSYHCISVIEGSLLLARVQNASAVVTDNTSLLSQHLRLLLGQPPRNQEGSRPQSRP
jgi:TetR/AcrR family transcriptional repressor of nem operon